MATRREIESILREIGQAQQGVVTRAQLLERGLASHMIDRLVCAGRVIVLRRGLYQLGPQPAARAAERAAVLACGPGARVSHTSAGAFHGVLDAKRVRRTVEVTVPRGNRRRIKGVKIRRTRDLLPDEVTVLDGIPVTTPARTLLDLAEVMTSRDLEQTLATSYRKGLVTRDEMLAMVERHPRHRGAPLLRRLLNDDADPAFTRSKAEEKLLELVRSAHLPRPALNANALGHEVDFLWRDARVVAEVDGYEFHSSKDSFAADRQRDAELAAAGYRVLRFTWDDVTDGRLATIVRLAQALVSQ